MDAVDAYIPTPERDVDKPFLMPVEDVFTITGRGTVGTGRVERGQVKVGEEVEIVGFDRSAPARRSSPASRCSASCSTRHRRRQRRRAAPRHRAQRHRARPGARQARLDQAAQEVQGRSLRPLEGRGRPPHAVLRKLSSAVLLPHDRRHRHDQAAGRRRDGHARRQRSDGRRADHADRVRRRPALRDPRGRSYRRRRRRHLDPE